MRTLAEYRVDEHHGFLPAVDPLVDMPAPFVAFEEVAQSLAPLIRAERVRSAIRLLPAIDVADCQSDAERERLFLVLCVLTNAWVWSESEIDLRVPSNLAVPVCALADDLGRHPIVSHASMDLQNWKRVHASEPMSPDNAELLVGFHRGTDETWFFTATLGVELAAAPIIVDLHAAVCAAADGGTHPEPDLEPDLETVQRHLIAAAEAAPSLTVALERMREWCDPQFFYHRLRPFLAGWPEPGVIYEGVSNEPRVLAGGSAGQSSVVQALDAAVGVRHDGMAGEFLGAMRNYMPPAHRQFITDLEAHSTLRAVATANPGTELSSAYDGVVAELDRFRQRHIRLSVDYITKPSGDSTGLGTGGSDFVELLRDARTDTLQARLPRS